MRRRTGGCSARDLFLCALVVLLFFAASVMDEPPQRDEAALTAATVAGAMEFDRVMELSGDTVAAMSASDRVFWRVLEGDGAP